MPHYSHGWTPADEAASIASAYAMQAHQAEQSAAQRIRDLERRVSELEDMLARRDTEPED